MKSNHQAEESLKTLQDIRGIMERSTRFLSLSGWSGVWAGGTALVCAFIAKWILDKSSFQRFNGKIHEQIFRMGSEGKDLIFIFILLAMLSLLIAFAGAYFFTWRKAKAKGQKMWNPASRQLMLQVAIPIAAGGIFCIGLLTQEILEFIAPTCLIFYGLALVNGSKYTLGEIRWLAYSEVILGCICLFMPYYGLVFLALGFGLLHIFYGIFMWNKYDKHEQV